MFFLSITILSAMPDASQAELLGDTLKPFASVTQIYDSNIFRVKDQNQLKLQIGDNKLSDFITDVSVGTEIHYQVSGQTLNLMLKHDFILYNHYANQNANRDTINGSLALSVLDKLKLTLDGSYAQAPEPRTDYVSAAVNELRETAAGATIGYEMVSGVGFAATYRHSAVDYSLQQYQANEYAKDLFSGTVSYRLSPDTYFYGSLQREYLNYHSGSILADSNNVSDSIRFGVNRTVGAKTIVSGYIGYLERKHDQASNRNFSGFVSYADINYGLSPILGLKLYCERQLYEETYTGRFYSINNAVGLGFMYQVSSKVKATIFDKLTWKNFKDIPNSGVAGRTDRMQDLSAGIEWSPLLRLTVSGGYQFSTRASNEVANNFSDHIIQTAISYRY